jgi:sugar lactone lactonase YvrE
VSTLAGTPSFYGGFADGIGPAAQFMNPSGVAVDSADNVYVVDTNNHRIRKITPAGEVSTLTKSGDLNLAYDVAVDGAGNVYVADSASNCIRKVTPEGVVTTLAGDGTRGYVDGPAASAQFNQPHGVAVDGAGNVYVADGNGIRKITPAGEVSTLAGISGWGVAVDGAGNVYVANGCIYKITPAGEVSTLAGDGTRGYADGPAASAQFNRPHGVAVDSAGNVYVGDRYNNRIRKITQ